MADGYQAVSFSSPQALIAPNLAAEQQQYARRVQLANALRGAALQDTNPGRGSVSWTQGLARLADALISKHEFKKSDQMIGDMSQAYARALGAQFGVQQPQQPTPQPMAQQPETQPQAAVYGSGGVDDNGSIPDPSQQTATPAQAAAPAPASPPPTPGPMPSTPGALALTGNPQTDMTMYAMDPQAYMQGVISAHAPVDMAKSVQQAQAAAARGDYATAAALYGNIQKQNYVAPVNVRQGSTILDPNTHQPIFENPRTPEGSVASFDANGHPTGVSMLPGAAGAIAEASGAQTAGKAAYTPYQTFDPNTGAPVYHTQAQVAQAAAGGNPMQAGPALGEQAAWNVTGTNSANEFQNISNGASDARTRIYALNQMKALVGDPNSQFGNGSTGLNKFSSFLGTMSQNLGISFNPKAATNADEFNKWATQYSARSGQELGLSGSDARTQLAIHATPNGEMTRQALQSVIPQMIGIENAKMGHAQAAVTWQQTHGPAKMGHAQAAVTWQQTHGPASYQQFATTWSQNYDPRIYTWLAQGNVKQNMADLKKRDPSDYNALIHKATVLGQIGAIPQ